MLLNRRKLNTQKLNFETAGTGWVFAGGVVATFGQSVASTFSGQAISVQQTVTTRSVATGNSVIVFGQKVVHTSNSALNVITIYNYVEAP